MRTIRLRYGYAPDQMVSVNSGAAKTLRYQLLEGDGSAVNLTGKAVTFAIYRIGSWALAHSGAASVVNEASGLLDIEIPGSTLIQDDPATYKCSFALLIYENAGQADERVFPVERHGHVIEVFGENPYALDVIQSAISRVEAVSKDLEGSVGDIDGSIEALEFRVENLETAWEGFADQVEVAVTAANNATAAASQAQAAAAIAAGTVAGVVVRIEDLESGFATLEGEVSTSGTILENNGLTAVTNISQRATNLETGLQNLDTSVSDLSSQVTTQAAVLGNNGLTAFTNISQRASAIEAGLALANDAIDSLQSSLTLQTLVLSNNGLEAGTNITQDVSIIQGAMTTLEATVASHAGVIAGNGLTAETNITQRVTAVEGDVSSLESTVTSQTSILSNNGLTAGTNITQRVTAVEGDVSSVQASLSSKVNVGDVVAAINLSADRINGARIEITGDTTFAPGYNPSTKINQGGAAADINANVTTISGAKITTGSITAAQIAAGTITGDKIAGSTITGDKIAGSTITGAKIAGGTITGDKIAASAITTDKLNVTSLSAITTNTGALSVTGSLTMNAAGKITNTEGDFTVGNEGISLLATTGAVFPGNSSQVARQIQWKQGATVYAAIAGTSGGRLYVEASDRLVLGASVLDLDANSIEIGGEVRTDLVLKKAPPASGARESPGIVGHAYSGPAASGSGFIQYHYSAANGYHWRMGNNAGGMSLEVSQTKGLLFGGEPVLHMPSGFDVLSGSYTPVFQRKIAVQIDGNIMYLYASTS